MISLIDRPRCSQCGDDFYEDHGQDIAICPECWDAS